MSINDDFFSNSRRAETVSGLAGEQSHNKESSAVLIKDLKEFLTAKPDLISMPITGIPTAQDYNNLRADILNINNLLMAISQSLQLRIK